ncbi:MAG: hypothetical protein K1X83_08490 [Oligoflexia bacterium]|nr:hypothetical protein [Oligoflexia bacterium]
MTDALAKESRLFQLTVKTLFAGMFLIVAATVTCYISVLFTLIQNPAVFMLVGTLVACTYITFQNVSAAIFAPAYSKHTRKQ